MQGSRSSRADFHAIFFLFHTVFATLITTAPLRIILHVVLKLENKALGVPLELCAEMMIFSIRHAAPPFRD